MGCAEMLRAPCSWAHFRVLWPVGRLAVTDFSFIPVLALVLENLGVVTERAQDAPRSLHLLSQGLALDPGHIQGFEFTAFQLLCHTCLSHKGR